MGIPVLTCMGETFASRVAASLLNSVQLTELITENLTDYAEKAIELSRNPATLKAIKARLVEQIPTSTAFQTAQFAEALQLQYKQIWQTVELAK